MRRLKHRKRPSSKNQGVKPVLLFLAGVAIGLSVFLGYEFYILSRAPKPAQTIPSPSPLPIGERVRVRGQAKPAVPTAKLTAPPIRVAIVLDDFGYNNKNVQAVFDIKKPITFSILPHLSYSKRIAKQAHEKGYEGILHLPLEPHEKEKVKPEINTIKTGMNTREVSDKLKKALEDVSYVTGVSNHQGSKATEDAALMTQIFCELKKKNLYFLDSLSTGKSACRKTARLVGIGFARRSVFLDNSEDFEYIKGQMEQLIRKAKKYNTAIGIGHDREKTVLALSKLMPDAEKQGIKFVFLSELVEKAREGRFQN